MNPLPAYQFYATSRRCPVCRQRIATATPLTIKFTQGPLHRMGLTCYCVSCNSRFRAVGCFRFGWVAWAGPLGRWIWWRTALLKPTTPAEDPPGR